MLGGLFSSASRTSNATDRSLFRSSDLTTDADADSVTALRLPLGFAR